MNQQTGKYILIAGGFIFVAGLIIYFFHDYFKWLGKLPGDISIKRENFQFYFPWVTLLLLIAVATILIAIIRKFL